MQLVLIILLAVSLTFASPFDGPTATYGLEEDLADFLALIPIDEIKNVFYDYIWNDGEVQAALEYVQSDEFKKIVLYVEKNDQFILMMKYLEQNGLHVYDLINRLNKFLELPPFNPVKLRISKIPGDGVLGLVNDIKKLMPVDKLSAMYFDKLKTSPAFAALINKLKSKEIKQVMEDAINSSEVKVLFEKMQEVGLNMQKEFDVFNQLFGWNLHTLLGEDLNDFMALIPKHEIELVFLDYMANDYEVQEAVDYVRSDEFKKIVVEAEKNAKFILMMRYLEKTGLRAYDFIIKLNEFFDLPPFNPAKLRQSKESGDGVLGLIEDIKKLIPVDKLITMYFGKLKSSSVFATLISKLESNEIKKAVEEAINNSETKTVLKKVKELGIDIQLFFDVLNALFGWNLDTRRERSINFSLNEDLSIALL